MSSIHPPTVLFVCKSNRGKSQMAEALLRHAAGAAVEVHSAGTRPALGQSPNAEAVVALAELGVQVELVDLHHDAVDLVLDVVPVLAAVGGHSHTVAVSHTMAVSRPAAVSHTVVVPACSVRNAPPVRTPRPLPEGLPGAILRILESGALHIDSICEESRQPVYLVSTALTDLELDGWVERRPGAVYVRR